MRVVDGVARRVRVEIGDGSGPYRPLLSGADVGDRVIRFPPARLTDGQRVTHRP
jgi:hypothetical protein